MVPNTDDRDDSVARAKRATELHRQIHRIKKQGATGVEAPRGESPADFVRRRMAELGAVKSGNGNKRPRKQ